jgi:hypothetical protein
LTNIEASPRATRASPGHRDRPPSARPRSAPATSAASACPPPPGAAAGTRPASPAPGGACCELPAGQRCMPGTGRACRSLPRPGTPPAGARPSLRDPPHGRTRPRSREISSRSASDSLSGDRRGSRFAGRCNATTARRMACRDRLISRCNLHAGAPPATNSAIRCRSASEIRSIQHLRPRSNSITTGYCVDLLRPRSLWVPRVIVDPRLRSDGSRPDLHERAICGCARPSLPGHDLAASWVWRIPAVSGESDRVAAADASTTEHRGIHADIHRIVLGSRPEDPRILGQVALPQRDHHAAGAGFGDGQSNGVTDRCGVADPVVLHEAPTRRSRCASLAAMP